MTPELGGAPSAPSDGMRAFPLALLVSLTVAACKSTSPPALRDEPVVLTSAPPRPVVAPVIDASDERDVQQWRARYPDAARELDAWRSGDEDGAAALLEWDEQHPDQLHVVVLWAMTYPYDDLGSLFLGRATWDAFAAVVASHPVAVRGFLGWCRRSVPAAVELARHPAALGLFLQGAAPRR